MLILSFSVAVCFFARDLLLSLACWEMVFEKICVAFFADFSIFFFRNYFATTNSTQHLARAVYHIDRVPRFFLDVSGWLVLVIVGWKG